MAPCDRLVVTVTGSICGVMPTATLVANSSASMTLPLVAALMAKTAGAITSIRRTSSMETLETPRSNALFSPRPLSILAMPPR